MPKTEKFKKLLVATKKQYGEKGGGKNETPKS